MKISAFGSETFLYLNGIGVNRPVKLRENIQLLPATCSVDTTTILGLSKDQGEFGIALIFLWLTKSQLHITSDNPKQLARDTWNSLWDATLLSAVYDCSAVCNFQCDKPIEEITDNCNLIVTNHHLRGLSKNSYTLNDDDVCWLEKYHRVAYALLDNPKFRNAVHCLATYHWHSLPNAQLTLIWSGIEGLFEVNSELVFRLSLYIANFLEGEDKKKRRETFNDVKKLYTARSKAVHGAKKSRGEVNSIDNSVKLLKRIIIKCIQDNKLPCIDELVP